MSDYNLFRVDSLKGKDMQGSRTRIYVFVGMILFFSGWLASLDLVFSQQNYTIVFKNGRTITVPCYKEEGDFIYASRYGGQVGFPKSEISEIKPTTNPTDEIVGGFGSSSSKSPPVYDTYAEEKLNSGEDLPPEEEPEIPPEEELMNPEGDDQEGGG